MACKDLSYLTCFNSDEKGHYTIKCSKPKKKETPPKSIASTVERRAILPTSVLKRRTKSQKTSNSLDDHRIDGLLWTATLLPCEKKSVLALLDSKSEVNAIHPTFAKELGLRVRPIA